MSQNNPTFFTSAAQLADRIKFIQNTNESVYLRVKDYNPNGLLYKDIYELIEDKCHYDFETKCLLWTQVNSKSGYGVFTRASQFLEDYPVETTTVTRVIYELLNQRSIPEGMDLRHLCRTRNCIQPCHLATGTPLENGRDRRLHNMGYRLTPSC